MPEMYSLGCNFAHVSHQSYRDSKIVRCAGRGAPAVRDSAAHVRRTTCTRAGGAMRRSRHRGAPARPGLRLALRPGSPAGGRLPVSPVLSEHVERSRAPCAASAHEAKLWGCCGERPDLPCAPMRPAVLTTYYSYHCTCRLCRWRRQTPIRRSSIRRWTPCSPSWRRYTAASVRKPSAHAGRSCSVLQPGWG